MPWNQTLTLFRSLMEVLIVNSCYDALYIGIYCMHLLYITWFILDHCKKDLFDVSSIYTLSDQQSATDKVIRNEILSFIENLSKRLTNFRSLHWICHRGNYYSPSYDGYGELSTPYDTTFEISIYAIYAIYYGINLGHRHEIRCNPDGVLRPRTPSDQDVIIIFIIPHCKQMVGPTMQHYLKLIYDEHYFAIYHILSSKLKNLKNSDFRRLDFMLSSLDGHKIYILFLFDKEFMINHHQNLVLIKFIYLWTIDKTQWIFISFCNGNVSRFDEENVTSTAEMYVFQNYI